METAPSAAAAVLNHTQSINMTAVLIEANVHFVALGKAILSLW